MSLRSFSHLITRSFYPRKINRAKVESYGAMVAAALTGEVGILIFKKHPDDDDGDVTMEDMKDVDNKPRQEDIKKDMGKHQMDMDMEAKFHKWIERMGREYPNQEEKAHRFELFKKG